MPPILCDERRVNLVKTSENEQRTRRKRARRRFTIGALERCEDRTLLTTIFGVTAESALIRSDTNTPSSILSSTPITNLGPGETIQGIDFRPATGQLYALTTDQGQTGRLYTIDPATAVAKLASTVDVPLTGGSFGVDFNPVVDRLRIVSASGLNLRINVETGAAVVDTPLAYGAGDAHSGQNPNVVGSAYSENFAGAGATTLYQIDTNLDVLAIQAPPNAGTLTTVGSLGVDVSNVVGFDIRTVGTTNIGYATLVDQGLGRLYQIDLATGSATALATLESPVTALAVAPEGFRSTVSNLTATFVGSPSGDQIVIDQAGGLLRHNQFDLGLREYNSPFDFDSSLAGDQTLSATDYAVTVVVVARYGYDKITLGSESAPISQLAASFRVDLQDGRFNQLIIDDGSDEIARTVSVDRMPEMPTYTPVALASPSTLTSSTKAMVYGFGPFITVESGFQLYTELRVKTGKGNDQLYVSESFALSGFRTHFDGGAGRDTLNANARGGSVDLSLSPISLRFLPLQAYSVYVGYQAIEKVNVSNVKGQTLTPLLLTPTINAVAGTSFDQALVAQFIDRDPGAKAADYDVTIRWGDGTSSKGLVLQDASDPTRFSVLGSHLYSNSGAYSITTTIVDTGGTFTITDQGIRTPPVVPLGESMPMSMPVPDFPDTLPDAVTTTFLAESPVSVNSQAVVKSAPPRVVGRLDPGTDTGLSNQDGITNDNTPAWSGTSDPGSVIRIYNGSDPATRQLLASAVADSSGAWLATALTPLSDGRYANLVAEATAVDGETRSIQTLAELTVDTVGPVISSLNFNRLQGRVNLTVQDDRSGLDLASVAAQGNYTFTGRTVAGPRRNRPFRITGVTATPQVALPNARAVNLIINQGRQLRGGRFTLTVRSGGIQDLAGNALDGEFTGAFPTGNVRPGGDFVARLRSFYRVNVKPSPISPDAPNRAAKLGHGQLAHSARATAARPQPAGPAVGMTLASRFPAPGRAHGR